MEEKYKIPFINACIRSMGHRFNLPTKIAEQDYTYRVLHIFTNYLTKNTRQEHSVNLPSIITIQK